MIEQAIEQALIEKLGDLKYSYRQDIRDRIMLEQNFREKFEALNRVNLKQDNDDSEGILHARLINILSHGNYSLYEPREMLEENKTYFKKILNDFLSRYPFNPSDFPKHPRPQRQKNELDILRTHLQFSSTTKMRDFDRWKPFVKFKP
ncbi:hypothetical protein [cf. Phormidesmis sp. LEGE 11477]|uniref:hypothetical protein n=1 Tax=cf. Phormidesmis sp. LEGE 11477 TaxID=1828680 RepID=UPI001D1429C2|nr:hypothetical protein [cf. Phormidesmis sp. LEGE 11477]